MQENDFGVALAVLRLIRGWSQEELARHAGLRTSSISDYERGKIVPGAIILDRIVSAMGYSFSALDGTRTLIGSLKADQALREAAKMVRRGAEERTGVGQARRSETEFREIEQASLEAGRAMTRLTRVFLSLVGSATFAPAAGAAEESDAAP